MKMLNNIIIPKNIFCGNKMNGMVKTIACSLHSKFKAVFILIILNTLLFTIIKKEFEQFSPKLSFFWKFSSNLKKHKCVLSVLGVLVY